MAQTGGISNYFEQLGSNNRAECIFVGDTGWEEGRAGDYYLNTGYVRKDRMIGKGVPLYDFMGNSYKNSMNWLGSGAMVQKWYSTTIWGTPLDRVYNPARLVMMTEGNAEDTCFWNRVELVPGPFAVAIEAENWWVQGWHQSKGEIQVFLTNFADGHAGRMDQRVVSTYSKYQPTSSTLHVGAPSVRGSRPVNMDTLPKGIGKNSGGKLGYWGNKMSEEPTGTSTTCPPNRSW